MNNMSKQHGLYKFVTCDTNEIIYIGKTHNNLKTRISDHIRAKGIDEKFQAYRDNYKVYVAFMPNPVEVDIMERALINKYKPVLNEIDNYKGMSGLIHVEEPNWREYNEVFPIVAKIHSQTKTTKKSEKTKPDDRKDKLYLGQVFGYDYYLRNSYYFKENGYKGYYFDTKDEALEYIRGILLLIQSFSDYDERWKQYILDSKYSQQFNSLWMSKNLNCGPCLERRKVRGYGYELYAIICSIEDSYNEDHFRILNKIYFNGISIDILFLIIDNLKTEITA